MSIEAPSRIGPVIIREGVYGATFTRDQESLFLRMERVTEETWPAWFKYRCNSVWTTNRFIGVSSGVLTQLVSSRSSNYPSYDEMKDLTGFTAEEYQAFSERFCALNETTQDKITQILKYNATGISAMVAGISAMGQYTGPDYVVYITRNRNFSILEADAYMTKNGRTLKSFINAYQDLLISVGSNFKEEKSFENRGISRNPRWVSEGKYSGLSMILHGFSGAVADKFFPKKEVMHVSPIGSMQNIIIKYLHRNEGYIALENGDKDLVDFEVDIDDVGESGMNVIKISALLRILNQATGGA